MVKLTTNDMARTPEQWKKLLDIKCAGWFVIGILIGIAATIATIAL